MKTRIPDGYHRAVAEQRSLAQRRAHIERKIEAAQHELVMIHLDYGVQIMAIELLEEQDAAFGTDD